MAYTPSSHTGVYARVGVLKARKDIVEADYNKGEPPHRPVLQSKNGVKAQRKTMPIIMYLGGNVKEYEEKSERIITEAISGGRLLCELCLKAMARHSSYERGKKETGEKLTITIVWCSKCRKWHALLPDFLLPRKHYSGNEIESVIIDSATLPVNQICTEASEATVWRWIEQVGDRIRQAVSLLKYIFGRAGQAVSEAAIDAGHCYEELELILEKAPQEIRCSGNRLGLANIWLGRNAAAAYI